jgi:hypothetical protein
MTTHTIDLTHYGIGGEAVAARRYTVQAEDPMEAHSQAAVAYQSEFPNGKIPRGHAMMTARTPHEK